MRKHDHRDPWMNQSREPMTAWERALRPSGPSNRVLFLLAVVVILALALSAFFGWSSWRGARAPHGPSVAPPQGNTAPAPPPGKEVRLPELQHPAPRVQHFTKCVSRTGAATYSDGACPAGTEASTVSVKPDTNLADGMSPESRIASIRRNSAAAQSAHPVGPSAVAGVGLQDQHPLRWFGEPQGLVPRMRARPAVRSLDTEGLK